MQPPALAKYPRNAPQNRKVTSAAPLPLYILGKALPKYQAVFPTNLDPLLALDHTRHSLEGIMNPTSTHTPSPAYRYHFKHPQLRQT